MITLDFLSAFGADVSAGMGRCLNNEAFYLRLVNMAVKDPSYPLLKESLAAGDLKTAFDAAHSLKGLLGNLGLSPLYDAASELTELLRHPKGDEDFEPLLTKLTEKYDELAAACEQL
ncbi:MAG: Hpt domain-containing protein [Lachnospiraceae bacterium]|nr:Hpt domain-containing protein [Lachnospiraceae bacterium]